MMRRSSNRCRNKHLQIHTEGQTFSCSVCKTSFSRQYELTNHMRIHTFSCSICQKSFSKKGVLTRHKLTIHTGEKPYCCFVCFKSFELKCKLVIHMRKHWSQKPYSCDICTKSYSSNSTLAKHIRIHTGQAPFCCRFCDMLFSFKKRLELHKKTHSNPKPPFSEKVPFALHMRIHTEQRQKLLELHKKTHSNPKLPFSEKKIVCTACKQSFQSKYNMFSHRMISSSRNILFDYIEAHTDGHLYFCNVCNKTFQEKWTLASHMQHHSGERLFTCSACTTEESASWYYERLDSCNVVSLCERCQHVSISCGSVEKLCSPRDHLGQHTGETHNNGSLYFCKVCKKILQEKWTLVSHMQQHHDHSGERLFICSACNTEESTTWYYVHVDSCNVVSLCEHCQHVPILCALCGSVETLCSLRDHLGQHTGETHNHNNNGHLYFRNVCNKTFQEKWPMASHMQHHSGEGLFTCSVCNTEESASWYYEHVDSCNVVSLCERCQHVPVLCALCGSVETLCLLRDHLGQHTGEVILS